MNTGAKFDPQLAAMIADGNEAVGIGLAELERGAAIIAARYGEDFRFRDLRGLWDTEDPTALIRAELGLFRHLHGLRLAQHLVEVIEGINARGVFRAAQAARAIIEVGASAVYWEMRVRDVLEPGVASSEERQSLRDVLGKMLSGGRFQWSRWSKSDSERAELLDEYAKGPEPQPANKQINVITMIPALDSQLAKDGVLVPGGARALYAILSDICHPSLGANIALMARIDETGGEFVVRPRVEDRELRWFCVNALVPALERVGMVMDRALGDIRRMAAACRLDANGRIHIDES